jgi:hypothetical protein
MYLSVVPLTVVVPTATEDAAAVIVPHPMPVFVVQIKALPAAEQVGTA